MYPSIRLPENKKFDDGLNSKLPQSDYDDP